MSSSQAIIRTAASGIQSAQYVATKNTMHRPQAPMLTKQFVREVLAIPPDTGANQMQPGVTVTFTQRRDYDLVNMWFLRFDTAALNAPVGPATFARWVDYLGFAMIDRLEVRSGTQRLQTILREELYIFFWKWLSQEQQQVVQRMVFSGTPALRSQNSLAAYEVMVPLFTCLGLGLYGDLSQGFYVRGLNDLLQLQVTLGAANTIIESDGALQAQPAGGWFANGVLHAEGTHIGRQERMMLASFYKERPFALTFNDQQYSVAFATQQAATAFPFAVTNTLNNINQALSAFFFIWRWSDDLARVTNGANGSRGRNYSNFGGVHSPGGAPTNSIVQDVQVRSGNSDLVATIPIQRLLDYHQTRDFKGIAGSGIGGVSYSRDITIPNAVLGVIGLDQIEQPLVTVNYRAPTRGTAFATINAAATGDIGGNSDVTFQVIGFTKNQIDQANFLLSRPFN